MEEAANTKTRDPNEIKIRAYQQEEKDPSFISSFIKDFLVRPEPLEVVNFANFLGIYIFLCLVISNSVSSTYLLIYPLIVFFFFKIRNSRKEKDRILISHRIPFFADAIANSLAVGCTLEQAFEQSIYYLRGDFKHEFEQVMLKYSMGKRVGPLLTHLDQRYPKTGLKYLICLLEEYQELGIGISPLLKRIAEALKVKEEADEKVHTILASGSSYARLSIGIFALSFVSFGFLLKDQIGALFSPSLKPIFIILAAWAVGGMLIVMRITSMEFSNHYALRPSIKPFMEKKRWSINDLLDYCGLEQALPFWRETLRYIPIVIGFIFAYSFSYYSGNFIMILIAYCAAILITRLLIEFTLKGLVEDQLIKAIETFPDFLQIFVIGLNSGLNQFRAFEFAQNAIGANAPELLRKELMRTQSALLCGENNTKTWQRLMGRLPFGTIIDFCDLMVISPLHGESIINSIEHMMANYQTKKLNLVEKKAMKLGQYVIPVIVIAFFPLFLFAVFGPLWVKISALFFVS